MFIKVWSVFGMDTFEKCVKIGKDPQFCSLLQKISQLSRELVDCAESLTPKDCYYVCLKMCDGECEIVCLNAVQAAFGIAMARKIARKAVVAVVLFSLDPVNAHAVVFDAELKKVEKMSCPEKAFGSRTLAAAAIELYKAFKIVPSLQERAQDVILLMAPALALVHQCGEDVFEYLDLIMPFVEEEAVKRIVAALEEGVVLVGEVDIRFEPVKTTQ